MPLQCSLSDSIQQRSFDKAIQSRKVRLNIFYSSLFYSAIQCFAGCHWERCRSANLIQSNGPTKECELFRESIVDVRRTDVLYFDRDTVHFDSIQCEEKVKTE